MAIIVWGQRGRPAAYLFLEILADRNAVTQTLAATRLENEVSCQSLTGSRLERTELDAGVGRVSGHNAPVVKCHLDKRLALCSRTKVGLETVGVNYRNVGLDGVQRRSRLGNVFRYVPSAARKHRVNGCDAVGRRLDFHIVYGLE